MDTASPSCTENNVSTPLENGVGESQQHDATTSETQNQDVEADAKVTHDNATTNPSESNSSVTDSVEDTSYENFLADLPTEYPDAPAIPEYTHLCVDDMLAMFVSRAELPGMAERRDKTLMKYLLDPTHFVQLIRCLLCPQVTSEEYKSKSSMVPYLATALFISPPNNDFIRELVKNREYLDAFFDLFTKYDDQDGCWSRVLTTIATQQQTAALLNTYFHGAPEPRGPSVFDSLLKVGRFANSNFIQCISTMVNPEATSFPWGDRLQSSKLVNGFIDRLEMFLESQSNLTYNDQMEIANIFELLHFIAIVNSKCTLAVQLMQRQFATTLIRCVFGDMSSPSKLSQHAYRLMTVLLKALYNDMKYMTESIPPLIDLIITPLEGASRSAVHALTDYILSPQLSLTHKVGFLEIVYALLRTNYGVLHRAMFEAGVFTACFQAMISAPRASILHGLVKEIITEVFYCDQSTWVVEWICKSSLLDHIIGLASWEPATPEGEVNGENTNGHPTIRWTGPTDIRPHIVFICTKLKNVSELLPELADLLKENPRWNEFYEHVVSHYQQQYVQLGNASKSNS